MRDPRIQQLAQNLINYSVNLKKGERIFIENTGSFKRDLVLALVEETYKVGGKPYVAIKDDQIERALRMGATLEHFNELAEYEVNIMKDTDCYIGLRANDNINELSDVPADKEKIYKQTIWDKVHHQHRLHKRWVILRYPSPSMAQAAKMSTEAFENFFFEVCNLDYEKMSQAMDQLVDLMNKTDQVHIVGPDTDLRFSIKDIPTIKCAGLVNIPDGEVFTAPVRDSVNGVISYNCPSPYEGFTYENVRLRFENGKIVEATANNTERINQVFDTDEGARYVGEFAIGVNPYIQNPMLDILFDEKIDGSFHFTPGSSYDEAFNGNKSNVHWDLVSIQRPEWGGGEIWFDGVLIRKDGRFVVPELECLNPENLK